MKKERQPRSAHRLDEADIIDNAIEKYSKEKGRRVAGFAIRFNSLLEEKGIHQEVIANETGISVGAISKYRNGTAEPSLSNIIAIADYLNVDCHYLMTGISTKDRTLKKQLGLSQEAINNLKQINKNPTHRGEISLEIINGILGSPLLGEFLLYAGDAYAIHEGAALGGFAAPSGTELSDSIKEDIEKGIEAIRYANGLGDYSKVVYSGRFAVEMTCRNALSRFEKILNSIVGLDK